MAETLPPKIIDAYFPFPCAAMQVERFLYKWLWEHAGQWLLVLDNLNAQGSEHVWELLHPVISAGMPWAYCSLVCVRARHGLRTRILGLYALLGELGGCEVWCPWWRR